MILLEPGNRILGEVISAQIVSDEIELADKADVGKSKKKKRDPLEVSLCDFDDTSYKVQVDADSVNILQLHMNLPCYHEIKDFGASDAITQHYGELVTEAAPGFDATLKIDLDNLPEDRAEFAKKLALFKHNTIGGVFNHFFDGVLRGEALDNFKFSLRGDCTLYFVPGKDRVVIVFALDFQDKTDKSIAKVFMQEFSEARRRLRQAPPISWGTEPPRELSAFGITENQGNLGYISFAILESHLTNGKKEKVASVMQSFRNYLQYHIKCSKAYFHSRMRLRVRELLKVLNRAKIVQEVKVKKTASGKSFNRK